MRDGKRCLDGKKKRKTVFGEVRGRVLMTWAGRKNFPITIPPFHLQSYLRFLSRQPSTHNKWAHPTSESDWGVPPCWRTSVT